LPPPLPVGAISASRTNVDTQLMADTIFGINMRWKDNVFQGVAILAFVLVGAGLGAFVSGDASEGALFGAGAGLILGFLASGCFLMIYRLIKRD
jgi:hypothetical protein